MNLAKNASKKEIDNRKVSDFSIQVDVDEGSENEIQNDENEYGSNQIINSSTSFNFSRKNSIFKEIFSFMEYIISSNSSFSS
jgi:hypothetical protein